MSCIYVGIDPGKTGGVAAIDEHGNLVLAEDMPILQLANKLAVVNPTELGEMILQARNGQSCQVLVERSQPMPRQGVSSTFHYGMGFGSLLGALVHNGIGFELVTASQWKKKMGLGKDKKQSIGMAVQRWPELTWRQKDHGVAEAALLACYCRGVRG